MVKFLLDAGADQEHKTDEMHTALMEASMDGHVEVARLLLDHGAQVHYCMMKKYHKILIISPGLIFVQKAFLTGLFLGELIFGGAYYWKEFCISNWVGLDNKNSLKYYRNSLKQLKTASTNIPWANIREDVLSEGILRLRFGGLIFGSTCFWGVYYRNFPVFCLT